MPSDRTRTSDDLAQQYQAVVLQQGRVLLDRDFNALQEIISGQSAADALDEVGPCGTPDNGFAVSLPASGASFSASAPDFAVAPGTLYVGGRRVSLPAAGGPWGYFNQPDWLSPDPPAAFSASHSGPLREFVYLHVFEQEVGAVEDPDLLDVALGGPDTTQRVRLMRRIKRSPATATAPAAALDEASAAWRRAGLALDAATMALAPQASLQVSFPAPAAGPPSLCDTAAPGGYLGAENQLIRVQICDPTPDGQARLLWGYDNASFLYRVAPQPDGITLQLNRPPVDAFHSPRQGQVVEVLRTAAVLGTVPDGTDPAHNPPVVRCVAEATGLVTAAQVYDPGGNKVMLTAPLPAAYRNDPNPLFLRVWQGLQTFDPASSQPVPLADPTGQPAPGLQVTITVPRIVVPVTPPPPPPGVRGRPEPVPLPARVALQVGAAPVAAFWQIAVRPGTPQAVYPERFLTGPQPPDGPRQWVCPLAVIDWGGPASASLPARPAAVGPVLGAPAAPGLSAPVAPFSVPPHSAPAGPVVHDCRSQFDNLVTLSNRRRGGCCTLTVLPTDAGQLQFLIDNATSGGGGPVAVCFAPGTYNLPQPLLLGGKQYAGLVLEGCPGGAVLQADSGADPSQFLDGLIVVVEAHGVTLRGLQLNLPAVPPATGTPVPGQPNVTSMVGARLLQSQGVRVERCDFRYAPPAAGGAFAAGLFVRGDCGGLAVRGCRFASSAPATATPAAVEGAASAAAQPLAFFGLLALPTSVLVGNAAQSFPPALHEAAFGDNDFVNLTLPLLAVADLGALRLEGNRVRGCLGGFWLEAADAVDPPDPPERAAVSWRACYAAADGFAEVRAGFAVGQSYPWPAGLDPTALQAWVQAPRAAAPLGLCISGNRVEAILAGSAAGGPGLTLALNRAQGADLGAALVVSGNEVRVRSAGATAPAALLSVAGGPSPSGPAALTGNLLVNTGAGPPPSLLIFPGGGTQNVVGLAVTGNVLVGPTNLGDLNLPPPLTTWVASNTIFPPPAAPAPVVAGLSPATGTANTSVAVTGSGFTGVTQVTFGGVPAVSFRFNSDRLVTAVAPVVAGAPAAEVVVWTPNGISTPLTKGADMFQYAAAPPPAVTGLSPTTGGLAGGYKVTITGSGFTGATQVKFGAAAVAAGAFTVNSDTSITATAPAAAAPGVVEVTVTTPSGTSTQTPPATDRFLYVGPPVVTGLSPSFVSGTRFEDDGGTIRLGGIPVTITGSGFTGATQVSFVGVIVPATQFKVNSDTSITVTAPVKDLSFSESGDVLVTTPSGSSAVVPADRFTYVVRIRLPPPPPPPPRHGPPHPPLRPLPE